MLEHPAMLRGTVDRVRFRGASLIGNALGDPVERELLVYLPPSYAIPSRSADPSPAHPRAARPALAAASAAEPVGGTTGASAELAVRSAGREGAGQVAGQDSGARRYPVVMVLSGYAATNASLLNFKPWEPNLLERYERLIAAGCGEALLVLPDCFTRLGGSQYLDSPALGNYQRYLADDVLEFVDAHYRTLPWRGARAIIGKSSGGFGALRMGMDRPERFSVIGSHAGDLGFELCIRPRLPEVAAIYERFGGAGAFLSALEQRGGPRSQSEFHALEFLAFAHAYAPLAADSGGADSGAGGELPFDPYTAELIPEKWARWLAHDPVVRAERGEHGLGEARFVFLDAGKSDEYGLQFGARALAKRLVKSGVAVEHEEFEGGHMGTAYRYDVSLPKIIAALDRDTARAAYSTSALALPDPAPSPGVPREAGAPASDGAAPHAQPAVAVGTQAVPALSRAPHHGCASGARVTREPL